MKNATDSSENSAIDSKQHEYKNPWTTLDEEVHYDNPWITVTHHNVINPAGNAGIYGKVHYKNIAVGIVPVDEDGYTWLVGQYRYPLDIYSWEIPEGGGLVSDDPLLAAKRELLEETGLSADNWQQVLELHLSNSVTDERAVTFLATGLRAGTAQPEETEQLLLKRVSLTEAVQMVHRGEITDALAVASLLRVDYLLNTIDGQPA